MKHGLTAQQVLEHIDEDVQRRYRMSADNAFFRFGDFNRLTSIQDNGTFSVDNRDGAVDVTSDRVVVTFSKTSIDHIHTVIL